MKKIRQNVCDARLLCWKFWWNFAGNFGV